jgi:hypothetical protein
MVWFHLYLFLFASIPLRDMWFWVYHPSKNKKAQPHGWACLTKELTTKSFNMNHKKHLKTKLCLNLTE